MGQDEVATVFRQAREQRGLSKAQVAEQIGMSPGTLVQLERGGIYEGMRVLDFLRVLSFYGIACQDVMGLLGFEGMSEPEPLAVAFATCRDLTTEQQEFVAGVLDVLLRGLHRT